MKERWVRLNVLRSRERTTTVQRHQLIYQQKEGKCNPYHLIKEHQFAVQTHKYFEDVSCFSNAMVMSKTFDSVFS